MCVWCAQLSQGAHIADWRLEKVSNARWVLYSSDIGVVSTHTHVPEQHCAKVSVCCEYVMSTWPDTR